jgi:hypothetical protein
MAIPAHFYTTLLDTAKTWLVTSLQLKKKIVPNKYGVT